MKGLLLIGVLALSGSAFADQPKGAPVPKKMKPDAPVYVMDKDAPSIDKTVPMARPRIAFKNK